MKKEVKIIGLGIKKGFGALKATELTFDENNKLTVIKGEVGAGKTTFKKAAELVTKGSSTLEDKKLYGNDVDIEAQLLDGERKIYVGCRSNADGSLSYSLYEYDSKGKKINNPVIDGVKATPAAYLKELQTELTWRLDELTSENPITQRNILLELYSNELEQKGVVFNKKSPNYVGGIIDQIEKAKDKRSYLDMERKKVGGIADDLKKDGIDVKDQRVLYNVKEVERQISELSATISFKKKNVTEVRKNELSEIKSKGIELSSKLKDINNGIVLSNAKLLQTYKNDLNAQQRRNKDFLEAKTTIENLLGIAEGEYLQKKYSLKFEEVQEPELDKELEFNERGSIVSKPDDFDNNEIKDLLTKYRQTLLEYQQLDKKPIDEVDTKKEEIELEELRKKLKLYEEENKITIAVQAFWDWKEQDKAVDDLNNDYYMRLTQINTGVRGLKIVPEENDIYLTYDGSYDPVYFCNEEKQLRKLSAYSDTQKPMICLLIQNMLLKKKNKTMPYLWIDQVPLDSKTISLLKKMTQELDLWLFVNWTGDFDKEELSSGEILIDGGEVFFNS